jgi:hypothetical protein
MLLPLHNATHQQANAAPKIQRANVLIAVSQSRPGFADPSPWQRRGNYFDATSARTLCGTEAISISAPSTAQDSARWG